MKMKKLAAVLLASVMMLSLTACSAVSVDGEGGGTKDQKESSEDSGDGDAGTGSGSIGLAVSTLNNPFFVTLSEGAKEAAAEKDAELIVVDAGDDAAKQTN